MAELSKKIFHLFGEQVEKSQNNSWLGLTLTATLSLKTWFLALFIGFQA